MKYKKKSIFGLFSSDSFFFFIIGTVLSVMFVYFIYKIVISLVKLFW